MVGNETDLGALIDPRPDEAKARDWSIAEAVASAAAVDWREIPKDRVRQFGVQNQHSKSDCVAETRRKLRRITFAVNKGMDVDFSSVHLYRERFNYPDGGMAAMDAINLDRTGKMTLGVLLPSEPYDTEVKANAVIVEPYMRDVGQLFKVENELVFPAGDLETVASTIQKTRKGAMAWFYFNSNEWSREVPAILDKNLSLTSPSTLRHSVTSVEPALHNGVKGMWIEDSAHFGGLSRRFITEEFYRARNWWASYPISLRYGSVKDTQDASLPRHTFSNALVFIPLSQRGDISDMALNTKQHDDVVALQDILKFEGLFPSNIDSTGYYGAITAKAVDAFQRKRAVAPVSELDALRGERVGEKTIAKLNQLYGQ